MAWRAGIGLDLGGLDLGIAIDLYAWSFVEQVYFLDAPLGRRVVPAHRNHHLLHDTRDRTCYLEEERRAVERGIPVDEVEKHLGRPVPSRKEREKERAAGAAKPAPPKPKVKPKPTPPEPPRP